MSRRQHSRMLGRERACKKVGPSVTVLDPVHDAKGAGSQVRTVGGASPGKSAGVGRRMHIGRGLLIDSAN